MVSSVTTTATALGSCTSAGEELIPRPQQNLDVVHDYSLDAAKFHPAEAFAFLQPDGTQPELRKPGIPLDMYVGRFCTVGGVEEEPVGTAPQDSWHRDAMHFGR